MNSVLLRALVTFIVTLFWLLSLFLFLRGHNEPGGGFIGALCFSLGFLVLAMAYDRPRAIFRVATPMAQAAAVLGFICFAFVLIVPLFFGLPPLTSLWTTMTIPVAGKLSSVLLFDLGVYLLVVAAIIFIFREVFEGHINE